MVTKTPRRNAKQAGGVCGSLAALPVSAFKIAERASASMARRSSRENSFSGRDDILGLRAGFHHAKLPALLDTVVELAPETVKVLGSGNQSAGHDQPKKNLRDGLQIGTAGAGNQHSYRTNLQNHFCFPQSRRGDGEAFGGGDVAQS